MIVEMKMILLAITLVLSGMAFQHDTRDNIELSDDDPVPGTIASGEVPMSKTGLSGFFTENQGQWDGGIEYMAETTFGRIALGEGCVYFDIIDGMVRPDVEDLPSEMDPTAPRPENDGRISEDVLSYSFKGGEACSPVGTDRMTHTTNYFIGNDPSRWVTNVRSFREVTYHDLWEGVDLRYHFTAEELKYDLILAPGAAVEDIRITVQGQDGIELNDHGSMMVYTENSVLRDEKLDVFYLDRPSERIGSRFVKVSDNTFGFELSAYQTDRYVVIDPVIGSTYLGGSSSDQGLSVDIDWEGNVVMAGCTSSTDFPTQVGSYDTTYAGSKDYFVAKFNGDCSQLFFSTFIGGSGDDGYYDNFVDAVDDGILMSGTTASSDFPTTSGCYDNAIGGSYDSIFLKLRPDGSDLMFSSYFGGGGSYDVARGILGSSDGGFFVYGYTYSADFPSTSGAFMSIMAGTSDGYISKFDESGKTLLHSTFLGGTSYYDYVYHLCEVTNNEIVVTGSTYSSDYPTTSGAYSQSMNGYSDCFVTRMKDDLSDIVCSTFYGGASTEKVISMAMDDEENVIVVGDTYSSDFPLSANALRTDFDGYSEGYATKFKHDLTALEASTFIGGSSYDTVACIAVDPFGNLMIAGYTNSNDLETTPDAEYRTNSGSKDGFISMMETDMSSLEYSTYFGGSSNDTIMENIAIDPNGKAVMAGYTTSHDLPVLNAFQSIYGGSTDAFVMAMDITPWLEPLTVESIGFFSDQDLMIEEDRFDLGQKVYVELAGTDANSTIRTGARVNITFMSGAFPPKRLVLLETEIDSGIYHGSFVIPLAATYFDIVRVTSWKDPSRKADLIVDYPFRPFQVTSLACFKDPAYTSDGDKFDLGDVVYLEVNGIDSNPIIADHAFINFTSDKNVSHRKLILLDETGLNTGIYRGSTRIPGDYRYFENITVYSVRNEEVMKTFMVHTPVQIRPLIDVKNTKEDEPYNVTYWNFGYEEVVTWKVDHSASWLTWDENTLELYGTPNNNHVGLWDVLVSINDTKGHKDSHEFQIKVINTPPTITTAPVTYALEGREYHVDYNCSDDGQGIMSWSMIPKNKWLSIDALTGELSGIPRNDDIGTLNISLIVGDGNSGMATLDFQIVVIGVNDPPKITTLDIKTGKQGQNYYRKYEAYDPDGDSPLTWSLRTDAAFLSMKADTGVLEGTPGKSDVGNFFVNITVSDPVGANTSREFVLSIENINDMPDWVDVPENLEITHGQWFRFDVNATDPDPGGFIEYSLTTDPTTDMEIDQNTGELEWLASVRPFESAPYELEVTIRASDGELFNKHEFKITVRPTLSPTVVVIGPIDGEKVPSQNFVLEWTGTDPENETLTYDIYIHETESYVSGLMSEALYRKDNEGTVLTITGLEQGKTYYWTIIPFDQCTFGTNEDGVLSFRINKVPRINDVPDQRVKSGSDLNYRLTGTDGDPEDSGGLQYALEQGPAGIIVSGSTGTVQWRPTDDQIGKHSITVSLSDGQDVSSMTFDIEVVKADEGISWITTALIIGFGIGILAIIILQILILTRRRSEKEIRKQIEMESKREFRDTIKEAADDLENIEMEPEAEPQEGEGIVGDESSTAPENIDAGQLPEGGGEIESQGPVN